VFVGIAEGQRGLEAASIQAAQQQGDARWAGDAVLPTMLPETDLELTFCHPNY
jgi:hypothetical protein